MTFLELHFDFEQILSAFIVIFAMIDITGAIPIIIDLKKKTGHIYPGKTTLYAGILLYAFLFAGNMILELFGVDIHSFAVAGAIVLFIMGMEMLSGREIMQYSGGPASASALVPLAFPLIAGAGTFTSLISLRAEYNILNIIIALALNLGFVYFVLNRYKMLEKLLGEGGIFVLRKFFGVILLAISVKLFTTNIAALLAGVVITK